MDLEIALGLLDMDMAIKEQAPEKPEGYATTEEKTHYAKWERANRMSILIMQK